MFIIIRYNQDHGKLHRNNILNAIFFSLVGLCVGAFASFTEVVPGIRTAV
jgi:hypothetical protein